MTTLDLSSLQYRKSSVRERADSQPSTKSPITGVINKGGPKTAKRPGPDLKTKFRLTPTDPEKLYWRQLSVNEKPGEHTMGEILHDIYGAEPGKHDIPNARMEVQVLNFDQIVMAYAGYVRSGSEADIIVFEDQMARWAAVKAYTIARNGKHRQVAQADQFFRYLAWHKVGNELAEFKPDESPIGNHVVCNTPDLAKDLYTDKLALGELCYAYEDENGRKKLVPWKYQGYLEFRLTALSDYATGGKWAFYPTGKIDIGEITTSLTHWAKECAKYGVSFSSLKFELFRKMVEIETPAFGEQAKGKTLAERRANKAKVKKGMTFLTITSESQIAMENIRRQHEAAALKRLAAPEEDINMLLIAGSEPEVPQPARNSPVAYRDNGNQPSPPPQFTIAEEDSEEDDSGHDEEVVGEIVSEFEWLTKENVLLVAEAETDRAAANILTISFPRRFQSDTQSAEFLADHFKATRRGWPKTSRTRVNMFVTIGLHIDADAAEMDRKKYRASKWNDASAEAKELLKSG